MLNAFMTGPLHGGSQVVKPAFTTVLTKPLTSVRSFNDRMLPGMSTGMSVKKNTRFFALSYVPYPWCFVLYL